MSERKAYDAFASTLKTYEFYVPTSEQMDVLRAACETDYGIDHDAAYAAELFHMACEHIGADGAAGSVGYVHSCYGDLVDFVHLVQCDVEEGSSINA